MVYGFASHCRMATLNAMMGDRKLSTMVSTTDLNVTNGKVSSFFCILMQVEKVLEWILKMAV